MLKTLLKAWWRGDSTSAASAIIELAMNLDNADLAQMRDYLHEIGQLRWPPVESYPHWHTMTDAEKDEAIRKAI